MRHIRRSFPRTAQLDDVKPRAEMRGMGEGAELGDGFRIVHAPGEDQGFREVCEVASLAVEYSGCVAERARGLC